jgi:ERF superfamily
MSATIATTDLAPEPAVLAVRAPRRRTARTFAVATADPPTLTDSLLNVVARAVHDPSIDVAKLEALLRMQREILADDARVQFHRAMIAAQGEMAPIVRDAENKQTNSRYARLETIDAAIRPVYLRHGFHLTFNSEPIDGPEMRIVCDVTHTPAGHTKRYHLDAAPETAGPKGTANKTALHGLGTTVTYLRRYLTVMIFNLVLTNEDTDGNRPQIVGFADKGADGEVGNRQAVDELYTLLAACSADPAAREANERVFLGKMGLGGLRSIADAPVRELPRLRNALLTKASVLEQRALVKLAARARQPINGEAAR